VISVTAVNSGERNNRRRTYLPIRGAYLAKDLLRSRCAESLVFIRVDHYSSRHDTAGRNLKARNGVFSVLAVSTIQA
jgi:hypothetical protein